MKRLLITVVVGVMAISFSACALRSEDNAGHDGGSAVLSVKGLVCEFCVKSIEDVLKKRVEVSGVSIDLKKALVTVKFKSGKTIDDETMKKLIKDAGYDIDTIKR